MSSIKLVGSTSGEITISAPAVAGTNTLTLPANTGEIITTGNLASNADTIKEGETWLLTSDVVGGGSFDITANLSRYTQDAASQMGTGMTESSGIFSFPSTGHYLINFFATFQNLGSDTSCALFMNYSADNGTSWSNALRAEAGQGAGGTINTTPSQSYIVDITDTANQKIKLATFSLNSTILGLAQYARTGFTVVRLGNT